MNGGEADSPQFTSKWRALECCMCRFRLWSGVVGNKGLLSRRVISFYPFKLILVAFDGGEVVVKDSLESF